MRSCFPALSDTATLAMQTVAWHPGRVLHYKYSGVTWGSSSIWERTPAKDLIPSFSSTVKRVEFGPAGPVRCCAPVSPAPDNLNRQLALGLGSVSTVSWLSYLKTCCTYIDICVCVCVCACSVHVYTHQKT